MNAATADFFLSPSSSTHKQYEALRAFFIEKTSAEVVAQKFGYSKATIYSMIRDFKARIRLEQEQDYFFKQHTAGRKIAPDQDELRTFIILLRKKYLSIPDIKVVLDAQGKSISERHIHNILRADGFARLPRRSKADKQSALPANIIKTEKATLLTTAEEEFNSQDAGVLLFLPYLKAYGIDALISNASYPGTKQIPKLNSILAFVALKLLNIRRYTADDLWCMDRGLGLFAGLNVLPKAGWYTSYSSRITGKMNLDFLKAMHALWYKHGLLSDTANLDFVAVPYWGEDTHIENNWSGTRHHALPSILAAIAEDPDTGLITYGDAKVRHEHESDVAVEFLDFYKQSGGDNLKYLVFDSKFTTYENLCKLDDSAIKFITIRRRGKKIVEEIESLPKEDWKQVRVPMANGKTRLLRINDKTVFIRNYGKELRQITITGHGRIKPALIITNDFEINQEDVIRKYARRWLVEKTISEQTHFFHLNRLSSSMVIKVDFDLTMSILAHNLYRLLAEDLPGYKQNSAQTLFEKFIHNAGFVECDSNQITVKLKKKRRLPMLLEAMDNHSSVKTAWIGDRQLKFEGATTT